jgi:hypothetical protein
MSKVLTLWLVTGMFVCVGAVASQEKPQSDRTPDKPRSEAAARVRPATHFRIVTGSLFALEAQLHEHGKWGWEAVSMVYDGRDYVVLMTLKDVPISAEARER